MESKLRKRGEVLGEAAGASGKNPAMLRLANEIIFHMEGDLLPKMKQDLINIDYYVSGKGRVSDTGERSLSSEEAKNVLEMKKVINKFLDTAKEYSNEIYKLTKLSR